MEQAEAEAKEDKRLEEPTGPDHSTRSIYEAWKLSEHRFLTRAQTLLTACPQRLSPINRLYACCLYLELCQFRR